MAWGEDNQLENFIVCGAPFGGPIAMIADSKKITSNKDIKEKILIYTSAGDQLSKIDWDGSNIVGMGWSDHEDLVTVNDAGIYFERIGFPRNSCLLLITFICQRRYRSDF